MPIPPSHAAHGAGFSRNRGLRFTGHTGRAALVSLLLGAGVAFANPILPVIPGLPPPNTPGVTSGTSVAIAYNGGDLALAPQQPGCNHDSNGYSVQCTWANSDDESQGGTHAASSTSAAAGIQNGLVQVGQPYGLGGLAVGQASVSGSEAHGDASASASSDMQAGTESTAGYNWFDNVTVNSDSLAFGTQVTLFASLTIDVQITGHGGGGAYVNGEVFGGGDGDFGFDTTAINEVDSFGNYAVYATPAEFTAYVGEVMPINGSFGLEVQSDSDQTTCLIGGVSGACGNESVTQDANGNEVLCTDCSGDGDGDATYAAWTATADHSAHFTLSSMDPSQDLTFTSDSGCSYTNGYGCDPVPSETPEPSPLWLLGTGFLALAGLLYRRSTAANASRA